MTKSAVSIKQNDRAVADRVPQPLVPALALLLPVTMTYGATTLLCSPYVAAMTPATTSIPTLMTYALP